MPGVETTHFEYGSHSTQWSRCRDAFAGEDAIKAKGEAYLPRLSGQTGNKSKDYDNYKLRAAWFGATRRTVNGLTGSVFRKDPQVEGLTDEDRLQDITLTGLPFPLFAKGVFNNTLSVGRHGVLVDVSADGSPYLVEYSAESIINWKVEAITGRHDLTRVVLREEITEESAEDKFAVDQLTQYRVLELIEGVYTVTIWRKVEKEWLPSEQIIPTRMEQALNFIPFCFFNPNGTETGVADSPVLDLVDLNLSHYRSSADLEHARHWVALPTPWIIGEHIETKEPFNVGSSSAWIIQDAKASIGMLEVTGAGISHLENALEQKEVQMAVIGARLLEEPKKAVEAAETQKIRQSGDASVLRSLAATASLGLSKCLTWFQWWTGGEGEVTVALNDDFVSAKLTPQELQAISEELIRGHISYPTYYRLLEEGEVTRPGVDWEDEKAQLEDEAMPAATQPGLEIDDDEAA
jgi:hypothetical protein